MAKNKLISQNKKSLQAGSKFWENNFQSGPIQI